MTTCYYKGYKSGPAKWKTHKVRWRKVPDGELLSSLCRFRTPFHAPDTVCSPTRKLHWALVWVLLRCHYISITDLIIDHVIELNLQAPLPPHQPHSETSLSASTLIWSEGLMNNSHSYYLRNSKDLEALPPRNQGQRPIKCVILQQIIRGNVW